MRAPLARGVFAALLLASSCVVRGDLPHETYRIRLDALLDDGSSLPTEDQALCLDLRGDNPKCPKGQVFKIDLTAVDSNGRVDTGFNGYVRITTRPGSIQSVEGDRANGRNVLLKDGVATGQLVRILGAFGPTRLQAEDEGYNPIDPTSARKPQCANGLDDDGDGLIDYPADPGCAAPNDDTETGGSAAAGVSPILYYQFPDIPAVQGLGPATPFQEEQVVVETRAEKGANLIVTRVSSSGMYVTDLAQDPVTGLYTPKDYGGQYVFNFQIPAGVRVCDRISYLAGTMSEFHGWTEMGFPSYGVVPWYPVGQPNSPGPCLVPEPIEITEGSCPMGKTCPTPWPWLVQSKNNPSLEKLESGLVRIRNARVGANFGPNLGKKQEFACRDAQGAVCTDCDPVLPMCKDAQGTPCTDCDIQFHNPAANACALTAGTQIEPNTALYKFDVDASACDLDHSGGTNFDTDIEETNCICWCTQDPQCSLFDSFEQRGSFRVIVGASAGVAANTILANTDTIATFDQRSYRGQTISSLTGTLSNFSGGDLNWTIETRCVDDLIVCPIGDAGCLANPPAPKPAGEACVKPRIQSDNEANTN